MEQHKEMIGRLKEERKGQENNHKLVLARLEAEKDVWFASTNSSKVDAIMQVRRVMYIHRWNGAHLFFNKNFQSNFPPSQSYSC